MRSLLEETPELRLIKNILQRFPSAARPKPHVLRVPIYPLGGAGAPNVGYNAGSRGLLSGSDDVAASLGKRVVRAMGAPKPARLSGRHARR